MLNIRTLPLGDYQTNCYIVWAEGEKWCVVIDPGDCPEQVLQATEEAGVKIDSVLLTHGHFDHVGAVKELASETGCQVYIHPDDLSMPPMMTAGPLYYTKTYAEGTQLKLAGLDIAVLHTPGHTPGSVCLLIGDTMITGDTLFAGSCGRTDLPGGDWATIRASLNRLAAIEANLWVLPGHGGTSQLREEIGRAHV